MCIYFQNGILQDDHLYETDIIHSEAAHVALCVLKCGERGDSVVIQHPVLQLCCDESQRGVGRTAVAVGFGGCGDADGEPVCDLHVDVAAEDGGSHRAGAACGGECYGGVFHHDLPCDDRRDDGRECAEHPVC